MPLREEEPIERLVEDDHIPDGTFFAALPHSIERMTANDAIEYAGFFSLVLNVSPHYSDEEKRVSIELRSSRKNLEKITDTSNWILLSVKDEKSGKTIGSLEAQMIANSKGERFGNIKWTLVHPEYWRQGIGTQLKLRFEELIKERGCAGVITAIKDDNIASIEMNRALGIVRDDSFPRTSSGLAWYTKRFVLGEK